ncbi:DUF4397 domain-containing protein [Mucilaginibacter sp.]
MNFRIFTILFFAAATGFISCTNKNFDLVTPLDINPPEVNTINATADTINIYQNGVRQNYTSSIYPGGATAYIAFTNGTQNFSIKKSGTAPVLFSEQFIISSRQFYSFFVTGTSSGDMFKTIDAIDTAESVISDSAAHNNYNVAMVRFVNASANSGALSVNVNTATATFSNINYAGSTPFVPFNASVPEHVQVFLANSTTPKIDSVFTFQTGIIYTLYTRGSLTGTGNQAFSISLATDPYIPPNQ